MSRLPQTVRFGTRGSELALWQTRYVASLLEAAHPGLQATCTVIKTRGDQIIDRPLPEVGGKGLFTAELEAALLAGEIDCAVHSLKDLPTEDAAGLVLGAVPVRTDPADALVSRSNYTLATLPQGASVGTSSTRRAAQLRFLRPDLRLLDIRGNVDTRIRKAFDPDGPYDAIVLARAGLERLGRMDAISDVMAFDAMLPAPGQGALAVQCRNEAALLELLAPIDHTPTRLAVTAERAFLAGLGGGCTVPVAALATWTGKSLALRGRVLAPDGTRQVEVEMTVDAPDLDSARAAGLAAARDAQARGAAELLELTR